MPERLARTMLAIENCENYLSGAESDFSAVQSYLTQYLLILLCADIEESIQRIVNERAAKSKDEHLEVYLRETSGSILRGVKFGALSEFLGKFGERTKESFRDSIEEREVSIYNNAILDRHKVAHNQGTNMSFHDMQAAVEIAAKILVSMEVVLDV